MTTSNKLPVTSRAIVQRINRALTPKAQKLYFYRSNTRKGFEDGAYVIIDDRKGSPVDGSPVDLEQLARKLDVMAEWESLGK